MLKHIKQDEATEHNAGGGDATNFEARAASMGWVPKEKWVHEPERWVDAKTFLENGEKVLPVILAQKRTLETTVQKLQSEIAETNKQVLEFRNMVTADAERKIKEARAQAEADRQAAITSGDGEAFATADRNLDEIKEQEREIAARKAAESKKPPVNTEGQHPDYQPWVQRNEWYINDTDLQIEANAYAAYVAKSRGLSGKALYDAVEKQIKENHPERFPGGAARGNVVDSGGDSGAGGGHVGQRSVSRTYNDLPDEAKKACDDFAKRGWLQGKDLAEQRANYCAAYQWEN